MNLNDEVKALEELERAIASGNQETIAKVAVANILPLYHEHYELLTSTVDRLPSKLIERFPILRFGHRMTPVLARTSRPFKPLIDPDAARTMSADELDVFTLVQMISFRFSGDVSAALVYARRLEDRILDVRVESRERVDGPLWFYHYEIGSTLLAAGDSSRALLEFSTARQLGRLSRQRDAERLALCRAALAHALRGSLDEAESALAEAALHPPPTASHVAASRTTEASAAALIAVERMTDDVDERLAELDAYDSVQLTWPFALLARARLLLARQRPGEALEAIRLAKDAHPVQHGSVASDVIAATLIDALCALGDSATAWEIAGSSASVGNMTRFAIIRLALHDSRFDVAAAEIRRLAGDSTLSPNQRAKGILFWAWLEVAEGADLDASTATQIHRLAVTGSIRRLLATVPRQLVDRVRAHLSGEELAEFDAATNDLTHFAMKMRPILTPSELRVLSALPTQPTTAAIASAFHVSPNTIKSQLKALYRKLGCSTRHEAIKIATRHRLLVHDGEVDTIDRLAVGPQNKRLDVGVH
ncbi:helix-turn-helix transcriptional regulator [Agromyces cerinus]|uniref:Regulatory protein, luxR family n=1 Tax=Agromyces cerinus subsp. cerinus TaxID=232089 RepID=A0A1N6IBI0_9MICO|nr:helix-turn-helix transcriptional regulator [Agromyces cerinus]SIO29351.1 regulatory protein, luxR family [Agromyces cerinus subsp. cerinus]